MCLFALTLVPEVFLDFSSHERAARKLFFSPLRGLLAVLSCREKIKKNLWDQGNSRSSIGSDYLSDLLLSTYHNYVETFSK